MPGALICIIIFVIWLKYQLSKSSKDEYQTSTLFWEKENQSNFVRRKDISNLDYISIPLNELPFIDNASQEILYVQDSIKKLATKKILNLTGYSNTDLKLTYGTANINALSDYDQNYTLLIRNLHKWASLLYDEGKIIESKTVLLFAVKCRTDISSTYILLATIYKDEKHPDKIQELIDIVNSQNSLIKETVLNSLNTIYEKACHIEK